MCFCWCVKGDLETLKKVLTLAVALAVVSSGYLCEVNGAAEPNNQKSAFHLRI